MNIHITENVDKIIDGFKMIPVINGSFDLSGIPDNSALNIVAVDAVDSIKFDFMEKFITDIRTKIRINGKVVIGGADLSTICGNVFDGKNTSKDFNNIIYSKKSCQNMSDIIDLLISVGLTINLVQFKGFNYEVTATRQS
jgi:hypothetical protein